MNNYESTEHPDADVVTVARLAEYFNVDRSVARKWLVKNGFKMRFIRLEETGNQLSAALSRGEATEAINWRKTQGFRVKATK